MVSRSVRTHHNSSSSRRGLTLLELVVVLSILVALATLIVPNISWFGQKSQVVSTRENLQRLQELLVNR